VRNTAHVAASLFSLRNVIGTVVTISVLTPSFNYAHWLPDTLASVAGQAGPPLEHVVVDDESTDNSWDVLTAYDKPVVLHRHTNRGLSETLNQALRLATGEWFGWLNADDFYLPGAVATVRRAIEEYPDADMIWGDCVYVDPDGRFLRLVAQHPTNRRVLRLMGTHIAPCATFVRRAALPSWIFDPRLRITMDWDLSLAMLHSGSRMIWLPTPLGAFRRHGNQLGQPASIEEHNHVRGRYGMVTDPTWRRWANRYGRVEHALHKTLSGSYRRQSRTASYAGQDMRWFSSNNALATVNRMVYTASGTRIRRWLSGNPTKHSNGSVRSQSEPGESKTVSN
jgi:glycosyltransferase involved in cell wall biosynthesis